MFSCLSDDQLYLVLTDTAGERSDLDTQLKEVRVGTHLIHHIYSSVNHGIDFSLFWGHCDRQQELCPEKLGE